MASGEVEPWIWKAAVAASKRYFRGLMDRATIGEKITYRTGYIMGYRAGARREVLRDRRRRRQSLGKS